MKNAEKGSPLRTGRHTIRGIIEMERELKVELRVLMKLKKAALPKRKARYFVFESCF